MQSLHSPSPGRRKLSWIFLLPNLPYLPREHSAERLIFESSSSASPWERNWHLNTRHGLLWWIALLTTYSALLARIVDATLAELQVMVMGTVLISFSLYCIASGVQTLWQQSHPERVRLFGADGPTRTLYAGKRTLPADRHERLSLSWFPVLPRRRQIAQTYRVVIRVYAHPHRGIRRKILDTSVVISIPEMVDVYHGAFPQEIEAFWQLVQEMGRILHLPCHRRDFQAPH